MNDKNILLFNHIELGDMLILNSLIRVYTKRYEHVTIFCRRKYLESIKQMFSGIGNLTCILVSDNKEQGLSELVRYYNNYKGRKINLSCYGDTMFNILAKEGYSFDDIFYMMGYVDYKKKFDFELIRNYDRENTLKNKLKLPKNYIFVHDDINRNFIIDNDFKGAYIVKPEQSLTDNIFDWLGVIEDAKEIHCINSSFLNLIDLVFKHEPCKLYFYDNIRPENKTAYSTTTPKLKFDWFIKR